MMAEIAVTIHIYGILIEFLNMLVLEIVDTNLTDVYIC